MATLTETAIIVRKILRYSIYGIVLIVVTRYTLGMSAKVYRYFFPEPPPPPTVEFGRITKIPFPQRTVVDYEKLTFILETPEGGLPKLPPQAKVYFMPKPSSNIRALDVAKQKVSALGFNPDGREITQTQYLFPHPSVPSTLEMNIVTQIFSISYDLRSDPSIIQSTPPTPDTAITQIQSYLARANLLPDDISGPTTTEFIKIDQREFVGAVSMSEANFIKVNLFRKSFDDIPSLTANPEQANIWFIVGSSKGRVSDKLAAEYHYFPVNESRYATYPLKTADQAWEDLKSGRGYIANYEGQPDIVKIRRIYLAYFDPSVYTEFYQPIVVFEGDNKFIAYVSAVSWEYYVSD